MRKLVTLKTIDALEPIPNADLIEVAVLGGWKSVVKKGEFTVGQTVLYFEIDSFLPASVPEFAFLSERSSREVTSPLTNEDMVGHVLRTMKLRGVYSQGLILPLSFGLTKNSSQEEVEAAMEALGVFKWEPPLPAGMEALGPFPTHLARKTDSERVQNLTDEFLQAMDPTEWVATEKIDGTSATFWKLDGKLHAAGRNWELSLEGGHPHAKIARALKLADALPEGAVIQAEIYGEGIQGNPLKMQGLHLAIFSTGFITPTAQSDETQQFMEWVVAHQAPRVDTLEFPRTVAEAVAQVDGLKSLITPTANAEGVVWWNINAKSFEELEGRPNFKAINNKFLLKQKD